MRTLFTVYRLGLGNFPDAGNTKIMELTSYMPRQRGLCLHCPRYYMVLFYEDSLARLMQEFKVTLFPEKKTAVILLYVSCWSLRSLPLYGDSKPDDSKIVFDYQTMVLLE